MQHDPDATISTHWLLCWWYIGDWRVHAVPQLSIFKPTIYIGLPSVSQSRPPPRLMVIVGFLSAKSHSVLCYNPFPQLNNLLPPDIRECNSLAAFGHHQMTHHFQLLYITPPIRQFNVDLYYCQTSDGIWSIWDGVSSMWGYVRDCPSPSPTVTRSSTHFQSFHHNSTPDMCKHVTSFKFRATMSTLTAVCICLLTISV